MILLPSFGSFATLPAVGNTVGDRRAAFDTGLIYEWDGAAWVGVGSRLSVVAPPDGSIIQNLPPPTISDVILTKELTYDFSVLGGAVGPVTLTGGQIPANSSIIAFVVSKRTNITAGVGSTVSFSIGGNNPDPSVFISLSTDLNTLGVSSNLLGGSLGFGITSAANLVMTIGVNPITAGKVRFVVAYTPFTP